MNSQEKKKSTRYKRRVLVGWKEYLILKTIQELEDEARKKNEEPVIYYSRLAKELKDKVVWAYIVKTLNKHIKAGTLEAKDAGRIKIIKLTDKGREYIRCVEKIIEILGANPNE